MIELNDSNYEKLISEESLKIPTVFFFYSKWCTHCRNLEKKLALIDLAKDKPCEFNIYSIKAENSLKILQKFQIRVYPSLLFLKNGKVISFFEGDKSQETLVTAFKDLCKGEGFFQKFINKLKK